MHHRRISLAALLTFIFTISSTPANFLRLFQTSQVLAQTASSREKEANRLLQQGVAQFNNDQIANARESLQKALTIYREIKDRQGESGALLFLGSTYSYREQKEYTTAIDYYQQALKIVQKLPNHANKGVILDGLGDAYRHLNNYTQAIQYYQQYLALDQQLQNSQNRVSVLGSLGKIYITLNDLSRGVGYYQQALALARATNDRDNEVVALENMGSVYIDLENYAAAIDVSRQGLALATDIPDSSAATQFLKSLSEAYYFLADYEQAIKYSQQSLAIAQTVKDLGGQEEALNALGNIYFQKSEYDKAIDYYQQVLAIDRSQKNRRGEGLVLGNIGLAYASKGEAAKAIDYLEKDLAIEREFGEHLKEGQTLGYLGTAYSQLKNYSKAIEYYQQSLAIARKVKYTRGEGKILYNLGIALIELGKLPEAEKTLFAAIEILESLRVKQGSNDGYKVSIFEDQATTYRLLEEVLIDQKKYEEALVISERGRARAFVDLLASRLSANTKRGTTQLLEPKIDKPTLPLLRQIAKQQNATLVEYSIDSITFSGKEEVDKALNIWVIKPTGEVTFRRGNILPIFEQKKINIGQIVGIGRNAIGARGRGGLYVTPDAPKAKNQFKLLHELLIKPIADLLPRKESDRVIFIPHSSLFLVPFAALQDEKGKYLIEKHTILTAPSIQVLDFTHKQRVGNGELGNGQVLVVGNPTMPKVILEPGKPAQQLISLPWAEKEAKNIASILKTEAITGDKATKVAILNKMKQARIIHLATHGLLDDNQGLGSAIALAPSSQDNGLLTAEEILNLKLNADLVVLSACDTGRGRITGDGVIGLSRSLISAGVPSVVVSLWAVDDNSTSFLMTEFYKNLQQKLDKATALRKAMLTTMQKYPEPLNWAAFTLIGES